ncbi:MAG: hypothetical protein IPM39_08135 [Chloroflexi bacterium]|nr:hypothetical protein [Chloroflexota bacterium]
MDTTVLHLYTDTPHKETEVYYLARMAEQPPAATILYAQLLQRKGVSPEIERDLDQIVNQSRRTSNIVRDLLEVVRHMIAEDPKGFNRSRNGAAARSCTTTAQRTRRVYNFNSVPLWYGRLDKSQKICPI